MVSPDNVNAPPLTYRSRLSDSEVALRRVLKSAPQDLWLDTLRRTRGPEHDGLVYWMLSQTECDFALAVHAFYRSNPAQFLDNPRPLPARPGPSDIFALVLLNWDTGSYRSHRLMVEAEDANPRSIARVNQKIMARPPGFLPFKVPRQFLSPTGGVPIKVPHYLSPDDARHLWPHYAALGLSVANAPPGIPRQMARAKSLIARLRHSGR